MLRPVLDRGSLLYRLWLVQWSFLSHNWFSSLCNLLIV